MNGSLFGLGASKHLKISGILQVIFSNSIISDVYLVAQGQACQETLQIREESETVPFLKILCGKGPRNTYNLDI